MPTLVEALEQKYGESSAESDGSEEEEGISVSIYVPSKSQRTAVPSLLVLNDCDITSAGERQSLIAKCSAVEELDLAKNKLKDWEEVLGILKQMPRLKFVNLSFNRLSSPLTQCELDQNFKWQQLRNLVLNSTNVDWKSVQQMLDCLPKLEELHLSLNEYEHVDLCGEKDCTCPKSEENSNDEEEVNCSCPTVDYRQKHKHQGIRKMHFTGNPVSHWREVCKIGYAFPNLESLVLAECPIRTLEVEEKDGEGNEREYSRSESVCESEGGRESPHDSFRKLRFLNLNSTLISTWDDIERLAKFPQLQRLRIQVNIGSINLYIISLFVLYAFLKMYILRRGMNDPLDKSRFIWKLVI